MTDKNPNSIGAITERKRLYGTSLICGSCVPASGGTPLDVYFESANGSAQCECPNCGELSTRAVPDCRAARVPDAPTP